MRGEPQGMGSVPLEEMGELGLCTLCEGTAGRQPSCDPGKGPPHTRARWHPALGLLISSTVRSTFPWLRSQPVGGIL